MNNNNSWYDHFLKALYEKFPKKSQLTEALMTLLSIEREAVYRRLRQEVAFSVLDIAKIANTWNISIDNILGITSEGSHLFQMNVLSYNSHLAKDYEVIKRYLHSLDAVTSSSNSQYAEISNILPKSLLGNYPLLSKFYMFKWFYQHGTDAHTPLFNQFVLPEEIVLLEKEFYIKFKEIKHLSYTWDNQIIQHLLNDIKYFESIYLFSQEDIQQIKQEIHTFLNDMENLSINGEFADTHNVVDLYIAQINIDTNCCYYYSPSTESYGVRVFSKHTSFSQDESMCKSFKSWMLTQKKISIPISQVNEKQRIEFFKKQREILKESL